MKSLKQQTISGLFWVFSESIIINLSSFIVGIILARLLTPKDYGLVGMIMVFVIISKVFVDSGLGQALIQKKDASDKDYSTVFIFNIIISSILYLIIFSLAGFVADFYKQTILKDVLRVLALILIIDSFALIHRTRLIKDLNFKTITKITSSSSIISGLSGVIFAYLGFGVWSLVFKTLIEQILNSTFLLIADKWLPAIKFDKNSFKILYKFGYKLLISSLIDSIYTNFYVFIIGRIFSPAILGYYSRAEQFRNLATNEITSTLQKVSYPVLSKMQDDSITLFNSYRKLICNSMFIISFTMATLFVIAEPLIIILIGEKWRQSIPLLQLLCFSGILYPIHAINLNLLIVKKRSDLYLKLEIIKKCIAIPIIISMSFFGIKYMIIGSIFTSIIGFWINTFYTGKLIDYNSIKQLLDISPSLILASVAVIITYLISIILPDIMWLKLFIQIISITTFYILGSIIFKFEEFHEIKNILLGYIPRKPALQ